ncbi:MAG: UvrD-helicase domain-containing protein [Brevibacillus sp.]|nr:UvrD-helicase domain-containing protein [Brevibacillus sp.]
MSTERQEWQEEQQRVDQVVNAITNRIAALQQDVSQIKEEVVHIRKHFWDDVTVNFDDPNETVETYASMKQQAEVLAERERTHRHAHRELTTLMKLKESPYFGRIDFKENGAQTTERIYLGIASFLDEDEETFLVYDWRAPVASLYYDYPPGPAQYDTPGGSVSGTLELKRQFVIRDGRIRSMFDTSVTIGDELLQEVLGKHADTKMKNIVATIQKEQNQIIRNTHSDLLVVQGAAGSGKTSAALQRAAYLLYRYRDTLRAEHIVLFSPNPMFTSYISTVLPELGEENVQQTTFQEYLEHRLGKIFRLEDPFEQLEYVHTASGETGYETRLNGIRYKSSLPFLHLMERYLAYLAGEGMIFTDLVFQGQTVVAAEQIKERFYSLDASLPIPNRLRLTADWLLAELKEQARLERKKQWVLEEVELLDQEAYQWAYRQLQKKKQRFRGRTFDDHRLEEKVLAAAVVNRHFKPLRTEVKRLRFIDVPAIYRQLFADPELVCRFASEVELPPAQEWQAICRQTVERLDRSELAYEDATPFLYLKERLEGFRVNTAVRHVFIDEAQDYSPFQFAFIKRLFPRCKMTVLGDRNQAIYAHATSSFGFASLASLFGTAQKETITLTRSYRSTRQIVEFTRQLIPGGESIEPINRDGRLPTLTRAADSTELAMKIKSRIRELQAAGHRTIAVICKTARECTEAYAALQGDFPLHLIGKETSSFTAGALVIPAYLAKGVEFDAVIIYDASRQRYGKESDRKLFYTACTRAMHELHLYYTGEISPFLIRLSPDTYQREPQRV